MVADIVPLPEIIECYNIAGDYDFMLKILVQDMASYQDFVIGEIKYSTTLEFRFYLPQIKRIKMIFRNDV